MSSIRGAAVVALIAGLLAAPGCRDALYPAAPPGDGPAQGRVVVEGRHIWGSDGYMLNSASIAGDTLAISASYAGGCRDHAFTLVVSASFAESDPVQLAATLAHDANGDSCEAWLTETHVFDLALVRSRYRAAYGPGPARVVLRIEGAPDDGLLYEFTA